jgi:diguanylate cyclase (GGDEF)-like protein
MRIRNFNVLLIEDNPGDVRLIQEMLFEIKEAKFNFIWADKLSKGLELLTRNGIDIVLLDLSLPDSQGLETFKKLHEKIPDIAIIVLTGLDDSTIGVRAVQEGAQDYLIKGKVDGQLLFRSICYAVERQRMLKKLKAMATTDELTGLYNRRGFLNFGKEFLKMAKRIKRAVFLLYADLDDLKLINDNFGHQEGDRALKEISNILKKSFRKTDIIARIGGDEFVILGLITSWSKEETLAEILINRLRRNVNLYNAMGNLPYKLSMSAGLVVFEPDSVNSIEELLQEADKLMYEQKRKRQKISK